MGEGVVLGPWHEFSKQCESVAVRGACVCLYREFLRMCTVQKECENGECCPWSVIAKIIGLF